MNTSESTAATAKHTISLFFPESTTPLYSEIPSINLDLNGHNNSTFIYDSIERIFKEAKLNKHKKTITSKIFCVSNYNGEQLVALGFLSGLSLTPQLVTLSCEFDVEFDIEMTDGDIFFNLISLIQNIGSVNVKVSLASPSNKGRLKLIKDRLKLIKYNNFLSSDIKQKDQVKLEESLLLGIHRDCETPSLYINRLIENNFKYIEESLKKRAGDSVWGHGALHYFMWFMA